MLKSVLKSSLALLVFVALRSQAVACPMCKMALEADDPQPRAYMLSILFMLAMIGGIFGGMTLVVIWLTRQERLSLESAGYQHLFENGATQAAIESRH